jgi:flagellar biosynthesis chaperone FliJ
MAFEYRLEVLLKLQTSLEHQEENRLLVCAGRVAQLKGEVERLSRERIERKRNELAEMEKSVVGIIVTVETECDESVKSLIADTEKHLKIAEQARLEQLIIYRTARQKREVLESLKERLKSIYDQDQLRRVQQGMDDTYLMRTFFWKKS